MKSSKSSKIRQWISVHIEKNPSRMILIGIVLGNIVFFLAGAFIISNLAPESVSHHGFWASVYYTIMMILDAGCVGNVVTDVGVKSLVLIIVCVTIVIIGMISFTGCVVGYVTNTISRFIDNSNAGLNKLTISNHTVILNWNNRASEILNDLMYSEHPETVVVLVDNNKELVQEEIKNRLADTIARENKAVLDMCENMGLFSRMIYYYFHRFKNKLTVIVRQGESYMEKTLMDISLDMAKTVIILNQSMVYNHCQYATEQQVKEMEKGNPLTIKTLVLVAEITSAENSADNQKIVVEVEDSWTEELVNKIIDHKMRLGKCNIIPVPITKILGQLLSQFSIMPQLNMVYGELFSNRGAEIYAIPAEREISKTKRDFLKMHSHAIPLTVMNTPKNGTQYYFMADKEQDLWTISDVEVGDYEVHANPQVWQPRRNILILGHNSRVSSLMDGFASYRNEWNRPNHEDVLNITVIDDKKGLEKMDYFRKYSYVNHVIEANIYDQNILKEAVNDFIDNEEGDTAILILSDDSVTNEALDSVALAYLISVQSILSERRALNNSNNTEERIDIIVEILNPKNFDVVRSYSVNNVVISNRYISKMITQIGEKEELFEFYNDILSYDEEDAESYSSMELYIKKVSDVFLEVPSPCMASQLIRAIYEDNKRFGEENSTIILGYLDSEDNMTLFSGDHTKIPVELKEDYKIIVFSNH